jgi:hypothetical protein
VMHAKPPWHRPVVWPCEGITITPVAAQLRLTTTRTQEGLAALNRERVGRAYERKQAGEDHCCIVPYNDVMLRKLVDLKLLDKEKMSDQKAVGRAVSLLWAFVDPSDPLNDFEKHPNGISKIIS